MQIALCVFHVSWSSLDPLVLLSCTFGAFLMRVCFPRWWREFLSMWLPILPTLQQYGFLTDSTRRSAILECLCKLLKSCDHSAHIKGDISCFRLLCQVSRWQQLPLREVQRECWETQFCWYYAMESRNGRDMLLEYHDILPFNDKTCGIYQRGWDNYVFLTWFW